MNFRDFSELSPLPGTPPGVRFRPAGRADAVPLYAACYTGQHRPRFLTRFRQSIKEQECGRRLHMLAETNMAIIGTGKLIRLPGKAEIADLMVASSWRGRGVGTAIIHLFLAEAVQWGYELVEIGAEISNVRALDLYRRLGFGEEREMTPPGKEPVIFLRWRMETNA